MLDSFINSATSGIGNSLTRMASTAVSALANPVVSRLQSSGLLPGGGRNLGIGSGIASVRFVDGMTGGRSTDWKVRISVHPSTFNFSGVLQPLEQRGGVIFPYTPQISTTYQANYSPQRFTHSNYNHFAYENSEVQLINVSGEFTAQDQEEAKYVLACIYFFRTVTKMYFGDDQRAGNPPPMVFLDGFGEQYFKKVPCVVTSFTHTMPNDADYIETTLDNGTRVPTISTIQIGLQPVYSKATIAQFNLQDFAEGRLVNKGFL